MEEEAIFGWFRRDRRDDKLIPTFGPYYTGHQKIIGYQQTHTREELLQLTDGVSDSKRKRISSAKIGTIFDFWDYSAQHAITLKRLNAEEITAAKHQNKLEADLKSVKQRIKDAVPEALLKEKAAIEKELRQFAKNLEALGL